MSVKRLKKVPYKGKIRAEDDNAIVDNFKGQLSLFSDLSNRMKDPDFAELISELKKIVDQMWYVKAGDPVQSKLHNLFVDAWNKQVEINEEFLKRLAFIPKEQYYVLAKAKARVLAWGVEKLPYSESYSLTTSPSAIQSGIDPYDPTWCPPEGWSEIIAFDKGIETLKTNMNYTIENNLFKGLICPADTPYLYRDGIQAKRVAVCFRFVHEAGEGNGGLDLDYMIAHADRKYWRYGIEVWGSSFSILYGAYPNEHYVLSGVTDTGWMVWVLDYEQEHFWWYDENKNIVDEHSTSYESSTGWTNRAGFQSPSSYYSIPMTAKLWMIVDWFAVLW